MRRLGEERKRVREATLKQEEDRNRLKLAEKDKIIDDMRKQVEELRRKSEQGSEQLQGEVRSWRLRRSFVASFQGTSSSLSLPVVPVPTSFKR